MYKPSGAVLITGVADVEDVEAWGGRAPDPRDHGPQGPRGEAGQYPNRDHLRQMRRAEPHLGREGRDAGEIRLQELWAQARDAVGIIGNRRSRNDGGLDFSLRPPQAFFTNAANASA